MYDALSTEFPDSTCSLETDCPENLAIRGILSAQCTDKRVNITARELFEKFPDMSAIASQDPETIAAVIKPCGLTGSKTKSVMAFAKKMTEEWGGVVPNDTELLMEVPGIGSICIGPCDLSGSMGILNQMQDEKLNSLLDEVCAKVKAKGKLLGTAAGDFPRWKQRGVDWFAGISDWGAMAAGLRNFRKACSEA